MIKDLKVILMKNEIYLIAATIILIVSCGKNMNEKVRSEDFQEFYAEFNRDVNFQNSRIKYPLQGKLIGSNNPNENHSYQWKLSDSLDFKIPELDTSIFRISRKVSKTSVSESIKIDDSSFYIEYRFSLINGKWFLVYYADLTGED